MKHAKLFPASGSKTWMSCAAAPTAQLEYENNSNIHADLGTLVHKVGDLCLASRDNRDADQYIGMDLKAYFPKGLMVSTVFPAEMAPYIQIYIDYCRALHTPDSKLMVENTVSYRPWIAKEARGKKDEEGFGTADCIVVNDSVCHIVDYKNGSGVLVEVIDNTQAMLYALGVYNELGFLYDFDKITMHIVQPRKHNICEWSISVKKLLKFAAKVTAQTRAAVQKNPPYNPTPDGCQWCRKGLAGDCDALIDYTLEITATLFDDMTTEDKRMLLDNKKLILSTIKSVEENVKGTLMTGEDFEGYKLVEGRSTRVWNEGAESYLKEYYDAEDIYKQSLIGVTAGDKLLTVEEMMQHTDKPAGKPTLAVQGDRRKALVFGVDFDALD